MADMKATWKVLVPPDNPPKEKMNNYNIGNIFSTTLRDTGEVELIDGDTKKIINTVKTGYAVHISRTSASGRYVYVIGRDGTQTNFNPGSASSVVGGELLPTRDFPVSDTDRFGAFVQDSVAAPDSRYMWIPGLRVDAFRGVGAQRAAWSRRRGAHRGLPQRHLLQAAREVAAS